jgi:transcriptional regulator with PAS, ATPase and Fis domain
VLLVSASANGGAPIGPRVVPIGRELLIARDDEGVDTGRAGRVTPGLWSVPDRQVSGRHARIGWGSHGWELEDLGSTNGTRLDGSKVGGRAPLREGAIILAGGHLAVFRTVSDAALAAIADDAAAPLGPVPTVSPGLALVVEKLRRLATWSGELLLVGETGVGKEVYARAVHAASGRRGALVAINCAAIPRELLESELFGYVKGAHSTATRDKPGQLEAAEGGTAFLDEIGEMPPELQAKLLRFLQEREVMPLGATRGRLIDARVIAATQEAALERLRDDLAGRLGAEPLRLPPLCERIEDLGPLIGHALKGRRLRFTPAALQALALYAWPRNARELAKVVETAAALSGASPAIDLLHLPEAVASSNAPPALSAQATSELSPLRKPRRPAPAREELEALLVQHRGNVAEVARSLDRKWQVVWRWLQAHGIDADRYRAG